MKTPIKSLFATLATGALATAAAAPALAQGYGWDGHRGWDRGGNPNRAINACSRVAERSAHRRGYERARVIDIRDVRDTRWGYEVRGRLNVRDFDGYGHGNGWGNGWRGDRYGWNDRGRRFDSGTFRCRFERGRVVALDIDGIGRL
jgi:hypothetical protein